MANSPYDTATHWDHVYAQGETTLSWYQTYPAMSLRMLQLAGVGQPESLVDVGGGTSRLVDVFVEGGHTDVAVLDVSAAALSYAKERLGDSPTRVQWLVADVRSWEPDRKYQVWHDRAVFHFLTTQEDRDRYVQTMGLAGSDVAVFGAFAPDGPESCSGLPVARYDAGGIAAQLDSGWELVAQQREDHATPGGAVQPFTWAAFRRR